MLVYVSLSALYLQQSLCLFFFFFNDTATTEIYTLSLHDALPITYPGTLVLAEDCSWLGASASRRNHASSSGQDRYSRRCRIVRGAALWRKPHRATPGRAARMGHPSAISANCPQPPVHAAPRDWANRTRHHRLGGRDDAADIPQPRRARLESADTA